MLSFGLVAPYRFLCSLSWSYMPLHTSRWSGTWNSPPPGSISSLGQLGGPALPGVSATGGVSLPVPPLPEDVCSSVCQSQPGLSLSMSLRPVSSRLVGLIQAGRYIEMRDLLGDNAVVGRRMEEIRDSMGASVLQVSAQPRVREVTSLPSWLCCS